MVLRIVWRSVWSLKLPVILPHTADAMPRLDVETSEYPPTALPTSTCPYEGVVESPVPPNATERVDVAESAPFIA